MKQQKVRRMKNRAKHRRGTQGPSTCQWSPRWGWENTTQAVQDMTTKNVPKSIKTSIRRTAWGPVYGHGFTVLDSMPCHSQQVNSTWTWPGDLILDHAGGGGELAPRPRWLSSPVEGAPRPGAAPASALRATVAVALTHQPATPS